MASDHEYVRHLSPVLSPCMTCVQCIGGCSEHWGLFRALGVVQRIGGCSAH